MAQIETYLVKIDQLPQEKLDAETPADAARMVGEMIATHESLKRLHDEEPVEIKRPDGRPWGRNLTIGAFRQGLVEAKDGEPDGPVRPPSV